MGRRPGLAIEKIQSSSGALGKAAAEDVPAVGTNDVQIAIGNRTQLAPSQFFSAGTPPFASTSEAWSATFGRRNSGESYSRAAIVNVIAMLPPTMSAIATQNNTKIRTNRLCIGYACAHVSV